MKKKVIHIIHNLEIGGVETAVLSSLEALNNSCDFTLVCIGYINPELKSQLSPEVYKNIITLNSLKSFNQFFKFIKTQTDALIISSLWKSHLVHFLIRLFYSSSYSIIFIHNTRFAHLLDRIGTLLGIKIASEIWTDSLSASEFIKSYCTPKLNIKIINFLLHHSSTKPFKQKTEEKYRFISLGRISSIKRLDLSIKFIQLLRNKNIDASLDIFGPDNGYLSTATTLIRQAQLEDFIHYKGVCKVHQVESVLSNYDAFVLMSDYEGMSISTVQAMEIGLLCFLRNVGEITNYGENMVNAVILNSLEPDDWEEFIENSVKVLTNHSLQKTILSNSTVKFANQLTYTQDILQNLERLTTTS